MNKKRQGQLFVVSGPSGAGKTSLIEKFLKKDKVSTFSISYTTRQKRGNEIDGKDYYFIDTETFQKMIEEGQFLEWENVHGYLYGTPLKGVRETLKNGTDIILDIDVKGALNVKKKCSEACLVFVEPPSKEELIKRLSLRGEKEIALRMQKVKEELEKKPEFEYIIKNDDFDEAYRSFLDTIKIVREKPHGENNC